MTIIAEAIFPNIYEDNVLNMELVLEDLEKIKNTLLRCYESEDPKMIISSCKLLEEPKQKINDGVVKFELTIITCVMNINMFVVGFEMLSVFMTDMQTKSDYTYDEGFFRYIRNDQECYGTDDGD